MKSAMITYLLAGAVALAPLGAQEAPSLFRPLATTDPNRDPNWDFWTNREYIFNYYRDGVVRETTPTRLPYYIQTHPTSDANWNPDVLPADGWMLVLRDFGTPSQAPVMPYFALYNKYRGILRLFILNAYHLQQSQYATSLQLFNPSQDAYRIALLTFPAESKCFLKDYDSGQQIYTLSNMPMYGWSHYDFILSGYDPTLINKPYVSLDLKTFGLNVQNLKMTGTSTAPLNR